MIENLILKHWRLILIAALVALAGLFFKLWQDTRAEYIAYGAGVDAMGRDALAEKERTEREQKTNLLEVKREFEDRLPEVRAHAVAAYRAARRVPANGAGKGSMPGIAARQPSDDGAREEPLPAGGTCDDAGFIADAAEDALIREQWRAYCIRNKCPIEQ